MGAVEPPSQPHRARFEKTVLELTLYSRPGCHLCDEMKAKIAPVAARYGFSLREVNIDVDEELRRRFNEEVPVLFLGRKKIAKYFLDMEQLERQLADTMER